ncbi:hypothetical protein P9239_05895 [Caballeronia sp. LZ062]|uniref:hypothetical protein n=1 Tax=unclassified Caballeronia TaxID=2646786 RepID=UPI00285F75EA|nr:MULTISPECIES: hypothetical protein [unclassified Caballeronia]MDR5856709.1 hypothetical protein [Caballeronia sp. LZ050]MDR5869893.1 hypothetical protein [Caballeronia sp. LZ062]
MAISAERLSDNEIKVDETVYTFDAKDTADAFQQCLGSDTLDTCRGHHAPVSTRAATPATGPAEGEPGSIISPSLGGMP